MTTRTLPRVHHRRRLLAAVSAASLVALAACGGTSGDEDAVGDDVPKIRIGSGGASNDGARTMAGVAAPEAASDMMIWMPTEYVLVGDLPALDTPLEGWVYPATGELNRERVGQILTALGLSGEPVALPDDFGGGWRVGPDDGTAPAIWFGRDGMQSWWYQPAWANDEPRIWCAEAEQLERDLAAAEEAAGADGSGGVSGDEGRATPVVEPTAPPADDPAVVVDPLPVEEPVCETPEPPAGVPNEGEARAKALELLSTLGVDAGTFEVEVMADEWSSWVNAWQLLDGRRSGSMWGFGFGGEGALTYASGFMASPQRTAAFPRVGTEVGFQRLQEGGKDWWWGGPGATAFRSDVAAETDAAVSDMVDEPEMGIPEPMPVDEMPPMEPQVVEIVDVREAIWTIYDADGTTWLVPAYEFLDANGGGYLVPAIPDEVVEVVEEPTPEVTEPEVTEPGAVEPTEPEVTEPEGGVSMPSDEELAALIGLTEDEAQAKVEGAGWVFRVLERDGESFPATADYREDRVNVTVAEGVVTAATMG